MNLKHFIQLLFWSVPVQAIAEAKGLTDIKDAPEVDFKFDYPKHKDKIFFIDKQFEVRINITNNSEQTKTVYSMTAYLTDPKDTTKDLKVLKSKDKDMKVIVKPNKTSFLKYRFTPTIVGEYGLIVLVDYYDLEEVDYKSIGVLDQIKISYSDTLYDAQRFYND